jgi:hypothetical protein
LFFLERGDDSAPTGDDESEDDYEDFWNYWNSYLNDGNESDADDEGNENIVENERGKGELMLYLDF